MCLTDEPFVAVIGLPNRFRGADLMAALQDHGFVPTLSEGVLVDEVDALSPKVFDAVGSRRVMRREMLRGEVGCALAHNRAYSAFLESGARVGVFFEDDVCLARGDLLRSTFAHVMRSEPTIVTLVQPPRFRADYSLLKRADREEAVVQELAVTPVLAAGYVLNRPAAQLLVEATVPVNCIADWPARAGGLLYWWGSVDDIVRPEETADSAISAPNERHVVESYASVVRRISALLHLTWLRYQSDYASYAAYIMHELIRGPFFSCISPGRASLFERTLLRAAVMWHREARSRWWRRHPLR